jgi:DNA-binding CsgD family transcriptional regulator
MSFKEDWGEHLISSPGFSTPLLIDTILKQGLSELTERELEITALLAQGFNSREIADKLNLSEHTVSTHRKQVIKKSGCRNTTHLVAICLRLGLI